MSRLRNIFGCDIRSLAVFRIALAFLLLYDVVDRFPHAEAFYSDSGFFSTEYAKAESPYGFSLNFLSGSVAYQQGIFVALGIAATALAFGCFTRTATLICWVLLVSIHVRNQFVLIGGDTLLRMLLFWSLFIPLGKAWSIDQWRKTEQPTSKKSKKKKKQAQAKPMLLATAGTACLIIQVAIMYWCAGVSKLTEPWLDGTSMEYVLRLDLYVRPFGEWSLGHPWILSAITYSTLVVELLFPFLLFLPFWTNRFRLLTILVFLGLHIGIEMALDVGNFGMVSMVSWIPLIPGCVWNCCCCCRPKVTKKRSGDSSEPEVVAIGTPEKQNRFAFVLQAIVPIFFLVYIMIWNYYGLYVIYGKQWRPELPESFFRVGWTTMTAQNFQMFGDPPRYNPTYVFSGRTRRGYEIDLIRNQNAEDSRPDREKKNPVSEEWKKLHRFLLRHPGNQKFHQALLEYYTKVWNDNHGDREQVTESKLECYYEPIGPEYQEGDYVRRPDLATWNAPEEAIEDNVKKTDEEIIDDVDAFFKGLNQSPIK